MEGTYWLCIRWPHHHHHHHHFSCSNRTCQSS